MNSDPATVYVVDDDQGARNSVRALARSMGAQSETFESAEEFLNQFDPNRPGCLVTDLRMMGMSGVELQEKLSADGFAIPVIIITAHAETPVTVKAVQQGAVTVLEKPCQDFELCDAIRDALARDADARSGAAEKREFHKRLRSLTPQQRDVLTLVIEGLPNKVIANQLEVSVRTVEHRRRRIFEITGAQSLAELIRQVVELGGDLKG